MPPIRLASTTRAPAAQKGTAMSTETETTPATETTAARPLAEAYLTADTDLARAQYESMFDGETPDSENFEAGVLSQDRAFLPPCVKAVLAGGKATGEFYRFLIDQAEEGEVEGDFDDLENARSDARAAWLDSDEPREHQFGCDGHWEKGHVHAPSEVDMALADWLRDGDWDTSEGTIWVDGNALPLDPVTGDAITTPVFEVHVTVRIDPEEPQCATGREHKWSSPHSVLGGLKDNPGVRGHGGGVIIREVCKHCRRYKETDTWAQRPDTGEQGLTSVAYSEPDEDSLGWDGKD